MKKFLAFTYYAGRPLGGMKDFLADFDSIPEALENILNEPNRYFQIVDRDSQRIVREGLSMFKDYDPREFKREGSGSLPAR